MHMEMEAVKLSPRARSALRGALKESLGKVRKKIRTIRAKKMDGTYEDEDVKTFNKLPTDMVEDNPEHEGMSRREIMEEEANEPEEEKIEEEEEGLESPELHTKAEREAFFRKSTKPKTGRVGIGKAMVHEEKDFGKKNKMKRNPLPGRKGGEVRSQFSAIAIPEEKDFGRKNKMTRNPAGMMRNGGRGH